MCFLFIHIISYVYQVIQLRLTLRELYYDEISDDEICDDEISYDEISHDEISDDEFSDDEISGNPKNHANGEAGLIPGKKRIIPVN